MTPHFPLIARCITNKQSCIAVLHILIRQYPEIQGLCLSPEVFDTIRKEIALEQNRWGPPPTGYSSMPIEIISLLGIKLYKEPRVWPP